MQMEKLYNTVINIQNLIGKMLNPMNNLISEGVL